MAPKIKLHSVENILFSSELVVLGTFRCPAADPLFEDSGPSNSNAIVFPRTVVRIEHLRGPAFLADPTIVPLYNRGQRYKRRAVSATDNSDWIVLADELLGEIADPGDPGGAARAAGSGQLFRSPFRASNPLVFLTQRKIFETLLSGSAADALMIEESAITVARSIIRENRAPAGGYSPAAAAEIVNAVKETIARDISANHSLSGLSSSRGISPFRLCRLFKSASGMTITEYRNTLRLRVAFSRIRKGVDLARLAADLGFSSHSHFTALFRRHFGITPTQYRGARVIGATHSELPPASRHRVFPL